MCVSNSLYVRLSKTGKMWRFTLLFSLMMLFVPWHVARAQQPSASPKPQFDEWSDDFSGDKLDDSKWEKFTFQGRQRRETRGAGGERADPGSRQDPCGCPLKKRIYRRPSDRRGTCRKGRSRLSRTGKQRSYSGLRALTILFDGSGRNRIEWILTSEGTFEAWAVTDGRSERLDNGKLGTKMKDPVLSIVRRGDEFLFVINNPKGKPQDAQIGLTKTISNMPRSFHLMLYGYGSSENNWDGPGL